MEERHNKIMMMQYVENTEEKLKLYVSHMEFIPLVPAQPRTPT